MTVPSVAERFSYADSLVQLFELGEGIDVNQVADLCDYVAETQQIEIDRMRFILECDQCPISPRLEKLPGYPHPQYIPLLFIKFEQYRAEVSASKYPHIAEVAWTLGALFRSIKPFNHGNAIIGHLIENYYLQLNGQPWRLKPLPREKFQEFHQRIFLKHYAKFVV